MEKIDMKPVLLHFDPEKGELTVIIEHDSLTFNNFLKGKHQEDDRPMHSAVLTPRAQGMLIRKLVANAKLEGE